MRTTALAVEGLLKTGGDYNARTRPSLNVFMATANSLVTRVVTCASRKGVTFSSTDLELMERWLSAHYYVQSDQTFQEKQTSSARGVAHGKTEKFLENSKYGQSALSLDPTGCLSGLTDPKKKASLHWGGKRPSEQTDFVNRS